MSGFDFISEYNDFLSKGLSDSFDDKFYDDLQEKIGSGDGFRIKRMLLDNLFRVDSVAGHFRNVVENILETRELLKDFSQEERVDLYNDVEDLIVQFDKFRLFFVQKMNSNEFFDKIIKKSHDLQPYILRLHNSIHAFDELYDNGILVLKCFRAELEHKSGEGEYTEIFNNKDELQIYLDSLK